MLAYKYYTFSLFRRIGNFLKETHNFRGKFDKFSKLFSMNILYGKMSKITGKIVICKAVYNSTLLLSNLDNCFCGVNQLDARRENSKISSPI